MRRAVAVLTPTGAVLTLYVITLLTVPRRRRPRRGMWRGLYDASAVMTLWCDRLADRAERHLTFDYDESEPSVIPRQRPGA